MVKDLLYKRYIWFLSISTLGIELKFPQNIWYVVEILHACPGAKFKFSCCK